MVERNMLSYHLSQRKYVNDCHLGGTDYIYSLLNEKDILLTSLKNIYSDNSSSINSELRYNNIGKLIEVKDNSGLCQSYLWDYNGRNVRLILDNVSSEDIKKEVPVGVIQCSNQNTDWNKLADQLRKTFSNSFIKQYDFNYKGNLTKII